MWVVKKQQLPRKSNLLDYFPVVDGQADKSSVEINKFMRMEKLVRMENLHTLLPGL